MQSNSWCKWLTQSDTVNLSQPLRFEFFHDIQEVVVHLRLISKLELYLIKVGKSVFHLQASKHNTAIILNSKSAVKVHSPKSTNVLKSSTLSLWNCCWPGVGAEGGGAWEWPWPTAAPVGWTRGPWWCVPVCAAGLSLCPCPPELWAKGTWRVKEKK